MDRASGTPAAETLRSWQHVSLGDLYWWGWVGNHWSAHCVFSKCILFMRLLFYSAMREVVGMTACTCSRQHMLTSVLSYYSCIIDRSRGIHAHAGALGLWGLRGAQCCQGNAFRFNALP